jgi:GrpB-like predicted nucleotidyltransferase (UPF0157 family)
MIGLKKGQVELCHHNDAWEEKARFIIEKLKDLFGALAIDIQHIGSTSVKHIMAKPIIDIVVGINDFDGIRRILPNLQSHGIIHRPNNDLPDYMMLVLGDNKEEIRTHHIHVVQYKGEEWYNQINFRDYLNANPMAAKEYEDLKLQLWKLFKDNRAAYTDGKEQYFKDVFKKAKEWSDGRMS